MAVRKPDKDSARTGAARQKWLESRDVRFFPGLRWSRANNTKIAQECCACQLYTQQ